MSSVAIFDDRRSAGRQLAARLERFRSARPIVLALPRGGVPVAHEIAQALGAELDLLLVRKLGAPANPEFAIGAVVDGNDPQLILNDEATGIIAVEPDYLKEEMNRQLIELERRRHAYLGRRDKPDLTRRTVIIVDDGIATGATITAALRAVLRNRPERVVLAVPVAPPDVIHKLRPLCDELVVLASPEPFYAVGRHYRRFDKVPDAEVIRLLREREPHPANR